MQRTQHYRWIGLLIGALLAGGGLLAWASGAGAAPPAPPRAPLIADPFHHLSGILLYPPDRMRATQPLNDWAGALTPPIFGPNISASLGNGSAQNETTIAINPEDNQRVIASANDYRCNLCPYVYLSTDGGASWVNNPVPGAGSLYYGDPAMTFGTGSYAYFAYLGYGGGLCSGVGGMYVSRSTDAGATFSPPTQLAANNPGGTYAILQDKEYIAVDNMPGSLYNGNVYEGWTRYAFQAGTNCGDPSTQVDASVILSRSTDHGLSWSVPITASPPISNNNSATLPVIGRHGEVYLYYVGAQTQSQLNYDSVLFSRSTDGGQTFPFFTHIASMVDLPSPLPHTSFRNNGFGAMAADQQVDGYLYAVWADYRTGDADILFSRSTDNGTTWSAPLRVNDDPVGNGKDQFFPWIATAPDGRVHIAWFDRREDPNDANYKEYYTDSLDRGLTFEPNVAVSTAPSVPGNNSFIGDYSGIAATTGAVIPIWTDMRVSGNEDAYVARGTYAVPTPTATPSNTPTETTTPTATTPASATPTAPSATQTAPTSATRTPGPPTATATACSITFTDVQPTDYFYEPVRYLYCRGVISGYGDNTFRPYNNTTRAQMVKIVVLGFGIAVQTPAGGAYTLHDVPPGAPFFDMIETAAAHQIVSGYNCGPGGPGPCDPQNRPYFLPNNAVTRGQLSKIDAVAAQWPLLNPATPTFSDVPPASPFYTYVETAVCHGVVSGYGDGTFHPFANATRGQISKIVYLSITAGGACNPPTASR